ncbi:MAG: glycosyltransferase [Patescibacteria group bacterium]
MKITALNKYNKSENIIIISNYPTFDKNDSMGNINGVSKYTYNLVSELGREMEATGGKIVILADLVSNSKPCSYEEDGILIVRCWRKDDRFVFKNIVSVVNKFKKINKIFVHFEFNLYGNMLTTLLFPNFIRNLRVRHKSISLLLHQVVKDLGELSGHLGLENNSLKIKILNKGIKSFYWTLLGSANKIIVHDLIFKDRLCEIRTKNPIFVIPHGMIDNSDYCEITDPRSKIGLRKKDFVILVFGFLTWYKGSDWIAKQFVNYYKKTGDDSIKLILAGGRSANLKDREFYQKYYFNLLNTIENYPNIIHTGFIPDEDVQDFYCASDVVVFPYRTHMSASGPFSLALSYDRPFLMSSEVSSVLDTPDIKLIMTDIGIEKNELIFSLNKPGDMFDKIGKLIESRKRRDLMSNLSEKVKEEREWGKTASKFLSIINA